MLNADYPESNWKAALKALGIFEQVTVYCPDCKRSSRVRADVSPCCPVCGSPVQEVRNPSDASSVPDRRS